VLIDTSSAKSLEASRGQYVAHLDDDDELLPNHLRSLSMMLMSGKYDVAYGRAYFETSEGWIVFGRPFDRSLLLNENLMVHSAVMFDRARLGHLRYDIEGTEPTDWRMWKKMDAAGARFGRSRAVVATHYAEESYRRGLPLGNVVRSICDSIKARLQRNGLPDLTAIESEIRTTAPRMFAVASKTIAQTASRRRVPALTVPPKHYEVQTKRLNRVGLSLGGTWRPIVGNK